jgi:hypothetical protein
MMKPVKIFLWFFVGLFCLSLTSCKNDNKDDFSGVSDLIANRNKSRYEVADRAVQEKNETSKQKTDDKFNSVKSGSKSKREKLSSIVLYQENVKILGSKSGKTLAKGVAYINKQGDIVKIKILKN